MGTASFERKLENWKWGFIENSLLQNNIHPCEVVSLLKSPNISPCQAKLPRTLSISGWRNLFSLEREVAYATTQDPAPPLWPSPQLPLALSCFVWKLYLVIKCFELSHVGSFWLTIYFRFLAKDGNLLLTYSWHNICSGSVLVEPSKSG